MIWIFIKETLSKIHPSITCHTVNNGMEAITYLQEAGIELPDVIFLDINMPFLNGRDTLVAIRNLNGLESMPIIMFSTTIQQDDEILFKYHQADYALKPNSIEEWFRVVHDKLGALVELYQPVARHK